MAAYKSRMNRFHNLMQTQIKEAQFDMIFIVLEQELDYKTYFRVSNRLIKEGSRKAIMEKIQ